MDKRYKKLAKNSAIFAIANFGSKILKFLMVPFYTYCLTTSEYGTVDTLITTINLLLPVIILAVHEAALRYALKQDEDNKVVLTNCFLIIIASAVVLLFSYFVFCKIKLFIGLWHLFYLVIVSNSAYYVIQNFTRGIGRSFVFALGGIINTMVLLSSNILLLAVFKLGVKGYLVSIFLSYIVASIYMGFTIKLHRLISFSAVDFNALKRMLKYSIPLIPTAMMWWVMNASDRYVINFFIGVSATGIYAVAHKIPTVITMFYQIFQQAWQISAVEEKNGADNEQIEHFYENVYLVFIKVLFLGTSVCILIVKPLIEAIISIDYATAWVYVPMLLIGTIFSSLAGFLGINYAVSEKTIGAFITSAISAVINFVLNIILTPCFGMQGTAIATFIGFYSLWLVRTRHSRIFIAMHQFYGLIHCFLSLMLIQSVLALNPNMFTILAQLAIIIIIICLSRKELKIMMRMTGKVFAKLWHR